jgi:hypothetical protein
MKINGRGEWRLRLCSLGTSIKQGRSPIQFRPQGVKTVLENILTTGTKEEQYPAAIEANVMSANPQPEFDRREAATDQAIAACGGNARDAVKALVVANEFLEAQVKELQAAVSNGYARGKFEPVPRDRKDWYD